MIEALAIDNPPPRKKRFAFGWISRIFGANRNWMICSMIPNEATRPFMRLYDRKGFCWVEVVGFAAKFRANKKSTFPRAECLTHPLLCKKWV